MTCQSGLENKALPTTSNSLQLHNYDENVLKENPIFKLSQAIRTTHALYLAHELNIFTILSSRTQINIKEFSETLNMTERALQALLSMCASVGLLNCNASGEYSLTKSAQYFLLPESPFYWGNLLNLHLSTPNALFSYEIFKKAMMSGTSQLYGVNDLFEATEKSQDLTVSFINAMHSKSAASCLFWPKVLSLSNNKIFLDIGGGSGAHSMQAVRKWPNLKAIIYDQSRVYEVATKFIKEAGLENSVSVCIGDMWKEPFPNADVHFYCDILHDWSHDKAKFLIAKSYESLPSNGRIILYELFFNDEKTGPVSTAADNISMFMWTEGQQYSEKEIYSFLEMTGFKNIQAFKTEFKDWGIMTAVK